MVLLALVIFCFPIVLICCLICSCITHTNERAATAISRRANSEVTVGVAAGSGTAAAAVAAASERKEMEMQVMLSRVNMLPVGNVLADNAEDGNDDTSQMTVFFDTLKSTEKTRKLDAKSECSICLVGYRHGDSVLRSSTGQCAHMYHKDCLTNWCLEGNTNCPTCRKEYLVSEHGSDVETEFMENTEFNA